MVHLPSGRCVALSSDRMLAYIRQFNVESASRLYGALQEPDDLLHILDVVYFEQAGNGTPYFAGYLASQWEAYAQDWPSHDKAIFRDWLHSGNCQSALEELLCSIKGEMSTKEFPRLAS